jgi:hypothetical protein
MARRFMLLGFLVLACTQPELVFALTTSCPSGTQILDTGWQAGNSGRHDFVDRIFKGDEWLLIVRARNNSGGIRQVTVDAGGCKIGPVQMNHGSTRTKNCIDEEHTPTGRYTLIVQKTGAGVEWNIKICQQ